MSCGLCSLHHGWHLSSPRVPPQSGLSRFGCLRGWGSMAKRQIPIRLVHPLLFLTFCKKLSQVNLTKFGFRDSRHPNERCSIEVAPEVDLAPGPAWHVTCFLLTCLDTIPSSTESAQFLPAPTPEHWTIPNLLARQPVPGELDCYGCNPPYIEAF